VNPKQISSSIRGKLQAKKTPTIRINTTIQRPSSKCVKLSRKMDTGKKTQVFILHPQSIKRSIQDWRETKQKNNKTKGIYRCRGDNNNQNKNKHHRILSWLMDMLLRNRMGSKVMNSMEVPSTWKNNIQDKHPTITTSAWARRALTTAVSF